MKLVEFRHGHPNMPDIRGDAVFVNPAYVVSVVAHNDDRDISVVTLAGGGVRHVTGDVTDVARRLAGAGVDRLPDPEAEARAARGFAYSLAARSYPHGSVWA